MATEPRLRTYLTRDEVAALLRASQKSRHGVRNHAMILLAYCHGLRASEVVGLRWSDVDLARGAIYCRRAKNSRAGVHSLKRDEVAVLERLQRRVMPCAGAYCCRRPKIDPLSGVMPI
jgi:type 1 fimbriae regulatory protein FimB